MMAKIGGHRCTTLLLLLQNALGVAAFSSLLFSSRRILPSSTSLHVQSRGLEKLVEGATPLEGGMTLYVKAGPDGKECGDCPFAHFVRMVLHEKSLEYDLIPCVQDTKPRWLVDFYEGKMPALQHRRECYVESEVIAQYLDFFFTPPSLRTKRALMDAATEACDGFFPAVAKYLKHTPDGDEDDLALQQNLRDALQKLETHLSSVEGGDFLCGEAFTLADCSLAPKLYHMTVGIEAFKNGAVDIATDFPVVQKYIDTVFARKSFVDALYPESTVTWGWGNARN